MDAKVAEGARIKTEESQDDSLSFELGKVKIGSIYGRQDN
jgi:hypothetical protein